MYGVRVYALTNLPLMQRRLQRTVRDAEVDIRGQVVQDLQRQVPQRLLGALDQLARVGRRERQAQVLADGLPRRLARRVHGVGVVRLLGEGVEVADQADEVVVGDVGLEAQLVLQRHSEGEDEVHRRPVDRKGQVVLAIYFSTAAVGGNPRTVSPADLPSPPRLPAQRC